MALTIRLSSADILSAFMTASVAALSSEVSSPALGLKNQDSTAVSKESD